MDNIRSICDTINCMLDLDLKIEDILNPESERLQHVLRTFLVATMNIPESSLINLPLLDFDASDFQETHTRSIPVALLYVTMNSFVTDFSTDPNTVLSYCDLVSPEPKMTRKLMYLVSEFLKFHSKYDKIFAEVSKTHEGQRKQLDDTLNLIEREEKRKAALRAQEDSRKRKENALLVQVGQKTNQLQQLLKQAEVYEGKRDEAVRTIEEKKSEKSELLLVKEDLSAQLDHVSKGIIKSPERVTSELRQQRENLNDLREDCKNTRKKFNEMKSRIDLVPSIEKQIDSLWEEYRKLPKLRTEYEQTKSDKEENERNLTEAECKLAQIVESIQSIERQIDEVQESTKRDEEFHNERLRELNNRLIELESDIINLREVNKDAKSDIKKRQKELANIKAQKGLLIRETENEICGMVKTYKDIMQRCTNEKVIFETNMEKLRSVLKTMEAAFTSEDIFDMTIDASIIM